MMQNVNLPKIEISVENIEKLLLIAREEALKNMAKRLPHLEESVAIEQIIKTAELEPQGNVAKHFNDYIVLALKTFL